MKYIAASRIRRFMLSPCPTLCITRIRLHCLLVTSCCFVKALLLHALGCWDMCVHSYFLPSTIIIWYPSLVLTSPIFGALVVLGSRLYATSSKLSIRLPRTFQPNEPPAVCQQSFRIFTNDLLLPCLCLQTILWARGNIPCLALSSLISLATSSNFAPFRIFSKASSFLLCFSHRICLTFILVAGLSLLLLPPPASFESPTSLPLPLFFGAMLCSVALVRMHEEITY